jgi:site-specific DNA-methyltransferase (adenine-specific)
LHHGEALSVVRSMSDASVDAIVTDPPYSSGGFTRGDRTGSTGKKYTLTGTLVERPEFAGDNRDQRSFGYWCSLWLSECLRVAKLAVDPPLAEVPPVASSKVIRRPPS